jgi:hypothetical protein
MEKGQYGYIARHKRNIIISLIMLGLVIIIGVTISVAMYHTTKTLIILIPILTSLPFAKQLVSFILCASFKPLTEEEHSRIEQEITYENKGDILYDISISRYEGIIYFPAVVVRDGRMLFLYKDKFNKKIPSVEVLKKEIKKSFEDQKKPYVVVMATSGDEFIKKANTIKAPEDTYVSLDKKMKNRLYELGV